MNLSHQHFSLVREIQKNYPKALPLAESVEQMLRSSEGAEPSEEAKCFLHKPWNNITTQELRDHFSAFYYFNEIFYTYYIPTVLVHGILEFEMVSDAVLLIICDMSDKSRDRLTSSYVTLNQNQLVSLKDWLLIIRPIVEDFLYIKEWNLARDNIVSMLSEHFNIS